MATLRQTARSTEENVARVKDAKPASQAAAVDNTKRRAFGDIGNVHGVMTRSQAAMLKAGVKPQTSLRPRDPNATVANHRARPPSQANAPAGVSLSSLLQHRADAAAAPSRALPRAVASPLPDIDSGDRNDPLSASEYASSIYRYYRRVEPKFAVAPDYMGGQIEVNDRMRGILIDWLVEVHLKFKLMPETLYLTTNLIDRFLAKRNVTRKRLQLVGVTAMLIASKYEEIWAPEVRDFVYISDKAYTRDEILQMEKRMLNELEFDLTLPTTFSFSARFRKAAGCAGDTKLSQVCDYLAELALVDYAMLAYKPSLVAAAALHISLRVLKRSDTYPRAMAKHAGYTLDQIAPCAESLLALMRKAPTASLTAVYKKYTAPKFGEVAKMQPPSDSDSDGAHLS